VTNARCVVMRSRYEDKIQKISNDKAVAQRCGTSHQNGYVTLHSHKC
jgi:hypothetical protein